MLFRRQQRVARRLRGRPAEAVGGRLIAAVDDDVDADGMPAASRPGRARMPPLSTPSRPDGSRLSGSTASGPASPISPMPRAIGNKVGRSTTPPRANGMTLPPSKTPPGAHRRKVLDPPIS